MRTVDIIPGRQNRFLGLFFCLAAEFGGMGMVSTYHGIETGRSAIEYFRKSMEISAINTFNSTKEGYSRQVVNTTASSALSLSVNSGQLGTGVQIKSIERMRNLFLDSQLSRASIDLAYWKTMSNGVTRVETFIVDTNARQLSNVLDSFWSSMQTVQVYPDDPAIRSILIPETESLVTFVNALYQNYTSYRDELNGDIRSMTDEANSLIDQIAVLNAGINKVRLAGAEPNELLDQRDLLAQRLCTLTGASVGTSRDELDGDYKIDINGVLIVQGSNVRHLVLVNNPANSNYYEVQIEYNQYDITSNPDVVQVIIERRADDLRAAQNSCTMDGTHQLTVVRLADEVCWSVGYGAGQLEGGSRLDEIKSPSQALSIDGSFALQVGSSGVRVLSEAFAKTPPGVGMMLGEPGIGEPTEYSFRIAAGDFEATISLEWDASASQWLISDNLGNGPVAATGAGGGLTVQDMSEFIGLNYAGNNITASFANNTLTIETTDRQLLSITDMAGTLARSSGLANGNPIVLIEVTENDTLQTIANKINNAYQFDRTDAGTLSYTTEPPGTAPGSPEEWLHASVESDENGNYFLVLTSNTAGEASRINVLSGSVCGGGDAELYVARLLGLVENDGGTGQADITSYIRIDPSDNSVATRYTPDGGVFVNDAYVIYDGREYLSSSNDFKDARKISLTGRAFADTLEEFSAGIRVSLTGAGDSTITVRHPLTQGEIFAAIKLRDDVLLGQMDTFDDIMYELASQVNALHYAGYGVGSYAETTGMAFFNQITGRYGAFNKLSMDALLAADPSRLATASGDGNGKSLGAHDGTNILSLAQLKQAQLFLSGTTDFNGLYKNFVADLGSFGAHAATLGDNAGYVCEQIELQRRSVMGVNADEEMLNIVTMTTAFNAASQYLSALIQVLDQIIAGVGRVGL